MALAVIAPAVAAAAVPAVFARGSFAVAVVGPGMGTDSGMFHHRASSPASGLVPVKQSALHEQLLQQGHLDRGARRGVQEGLVVLLETVFRVELVVDRTPHLPLWPWTAVA